MRTLIPPKWEGSRFKIFPIYTKLEKLLKFRRDGKVVISVLDIDGSQACYRALLIEAVPHFGNTVVSDWKITAKGVQGAEVHDEAKFMLLFFGNYKCPTTKL